MSKPVARPNYEIIESIIRVEFETGLVASITATGFYAGIDNEIQCDEMAGYLLGRTGETASAIVPQKLNGGFIGTANRERAAVQVRNRQLLEPLARVCRVKRLRTIDYISKNVLNFGGCHTSVLTCTGVRCKKQMPTGTSMLEDIHFVPHLSGIRQHSISAK